MISVFQFAIYLNLQFILCYCFGNLTSDSELITDTTVGPEGAILGQNPEFSKI